jgi:regulatory protein
MMDEPQARNALIRYLSRREHSEYELKNKLLNKGFELNVIENAMLFLHEHDLQSDLRFAQAKVRDLASRGYGEIKAKSELQNHNITSDLIEDALYGQKIDWLGVVGQLLARKYLAELSVPQKIIRKLIQRGFKYDQISQALKVIDEENP